MQLIWRYGHAPIGIHLFELLIPVFFSLTCLVDLTPLFWAMLGGSMDTMSYLLDHGANPHKVDDEGFNPLHRAARRGINSLPAHGHFSSGALQYCSIMILMCVGKRVCRS